MYDDQKIETENEILTRLARGEEEIARGEGYDLDEVLSQAESLLRSHCNPEETAE